MHVHSDENTCRKIIIIIIATTTTFAIAQNFRTNYSRIIILEKI